jgi:CheY-like chemotaxis protein
MKSAPTILAVEDDPRALRALQQTLRHAGYSVLAARSGEEALAALETSFPELVLLDVSLPGLSGYDVCRRIRANPRTRVLPVVFLSAHERAPEEGGNTLHIMKPVLASELLKVVRLFV